jgi:hypothetical protein
MLRRFSKILMANVTMLLYLDKVFMHLLGAMLFRDILLLPWIMKLLLEQFEEEFRYLNLTFIMV